jgi:5-methylcytosine-specific restriction endonuclease McrA
MKNLLQINPKNTIFIHPGIHTHVSRSLSLRVTSAGVFYLESDEMTKGDGKPCKKCGTSEWYKGGGCKACAIDQATRWQRNNLEKHNEKTRRWQRKNPNKVREMARNWDRNNSDKVTAKKNRRRTAKNQAGGSYTVAEWKTLCEQYDNRCLRCGKKEKLTFDHVIPVSKGGSSDISNGQPLCFSCNAGKRDKTTDYRTKPGIKRWFQKRLFGD